MSVVTWIGAGKAWFDGIERWRGPIDVFWFLYFAAHLCVGRNGIEGALGPIGAVAVVVLTLFLVFVLPFIPRSQPAK